MSWRTAAGTTRINIRPYKYSTPNPKLVHIIRPLIFDPLGVECSKKTYLCLIVPLLCLVPCV